MAQGTRGRWMRLAATGFGVLLCTSLVGCWNTDKPKDTKATTKQYLPGTTRLDSAGNPINTNSSQNPAYRSTGLNSQSSSGLNSNPAAGLGNGQPQRIYTDGRNTNNSSVVQPANYQDAPGFGGMPPGPAGAINSPAMPGIVQPPAPTGRYGSASQYQNNSAGAGSVPPPPTLSTIPSPPPPPPITSGAGDFGSAAPIPPPPPPGLGVPPSTPPAGISGKNTGFGSVGVYPNQ